MYVFVRHKNLRLEKIMNPKVSVFITSYNQKDYLIEAVESVLNQTLKPFEIIIADDCSTDGSQEIIWEYARKYPDLIRPFCHSQNLGIPKNKRFALEQVQGDLVTYLDGDDRYLPRKLELELETLRNHPEAQIVYSNIYFIDPDGKRTGQWIDNNSLPPNGHVFTEVFGRAFPKNTLFRNEIIDYQCVKGTGFYDEEFAMYHDWELRIRLTKTLKVTYCPETLAEYRLHPSGISKSVSVRHLDEMKRVYVKNRSLLNDLPETERRTVEEKLSSIFGQLTRKASREELAKGNKQHALNYWLESWRYNHKRFDFTLPVQLILPKWLFSQLKVVYLSLRGVQH